MSALYSGFNIFLKWACAKGAQGIIVACRIRNCNGRYQDCTMGRNWKQLSQIQSFALCVVFKVNQTVLLLVKSSNGLCSGLRESKVNLDAIHSWLEFFLEWELEFWWGPVIVPGVKSRAISTIDLCTMIGCTLQCWSMYCMCQNPTCKSHEL